MKRTKVLKTGWGRRRSDRGASAVEFALVVPIFLVFVFGIIQYGTIFLVRNQMTEAASDAAHTAVTSTTVAAAEAAALSAVQQDLPNDGAGLMSATCSAGGPVTCTAAPPATCNAPSGYQCLQVTITYNYGAHPVLAFPLLPTPSTLTASSTVLIADPTGA